MNLKREKPTKNLIDRTELNSWITFWFFLVQKDEEKRTSKRQNIFQDINRVSGLHLWTVIFELCSIDPLELLGGLLMMFEAEKLTF